MRLVGEPTLCDIIDLLGFRLLPFMFWRLIECLGDRFFLLSFDLGVFVDEVSLVFS